MSRQTFSLAAQHPTRDGLTISRRVDLRAETAVTCFSLGRETDISPERYDRPVLYLGLSGRGDFAVGGISPAKAVRSGELLFVPKNTSCGVTTQSGFVYTEIMPREELIMNHAVKAGEVLKLAELVPYEEGSIVNMDIASNDAMKFVVMAFDEGTGLSPHRAPGDALVFALEGKAIIGYEGKEYAIEAGENFRFDKNGLHSVTANGRFKMALLLTLK